MIDYKHVLALIEGTEAKLLLLLWKVVIFGFLKSQATVLMDHKFLLADNVLGRNKLKMCLWRIDH